MVSKGGDATDQMRFIARKACTNQKKGVFLDGIMCSLMQKIPRTQLFGGVYLYENQVI